MKTNITYIISNINKSLSFEWIAGCLDKAAFNLNFILLNKGDSELENFLKKNSIPVDRIYYTSKKNIPKAIITTFNILKKHNTSIVHTHLFDANIIGLTAAWFAGVPKRIHTRHHSDYHHICYPKAVKYDKLVNYLSTDIIAISEVVKNILITKEHVSPNKIELIHHGFQLENFTNVSAESLKQLSVLYNPNHYHPVIGVISRYTEWKGIQYIIPAFKKLLKTKPSAILILANANGDYKNEINTLLSNIPKKNYIEIPFENDICSLYKLFDVFIHVPITPEAEAFGQTYVEALAAGIPSIFTLSGVANEFIEDRKNAIIVPYMDSEAIYNAATELIENKTLCAFLKDNGEKDIRQKFTLDKMILSLEQLYAG